MAKISGVIGYGITSETSPGVWTSSIVERNFFGELVKGTQKLISSDKVNIDVNFSDNISIIADAYAFNNCMLMRYVNWRGIKIKVESFEIKYPRLILTLGGIYNEQD